MELMEWEDIYSEQQLKDMIAAEKHAVDMLKKFKEHFRKELKNLINVRNLWRWLDENDHWEPHGIFEATIFNKQGNNRFMHQAVFSGIATGEMDHQKESKKETGANHIFIKQWTQGEDSYSGFIAIPLANRKYFIISYDC